MPEPIKINPWTLCIDCGRSGEEGAYMSIIRLDNKEVPMCLNCLKFRVINDIKGLSNDE